MSIPSNNNKDIIAFKSNSSFICSDYSSILISEERNVFSFGLNKNGFLGHEAIGKVINSPKQIPNLLNIKMVALGRNHTVCIDYEGNLFTFGNNDDKQLGIGKNRIVCLSGNFTEIPRRIVDIPPIDYISCGSIFTICITNYRTCYSFGCNNHGQLGIGSNNYDDCRWPRLIPDFNDIELAQCGIRYVICKSYSNEYYSWGENLYGQLGQGNYDDCNKPQKCLNWPEDIIDIKCGYDHSILLTSTGYVYSVGNNYCSQLGLNDKNIKTTNIPTLIKDLPLIKRIECGNYHSMCIDINDKLWVFGNNECGQLGLGDREDRYKPTLNESLHDIIDISSGGSHTFVKTIYNEIYAFGNSQYSQLGIETSKKYQLTPIQVFKDTEEIWGSINRRSKQKSARK